MQWGTITSFLLVTLTISCVVWGSLNQHVVYGLAIYGVTFDTCFATV